MVPSKAMRSKQEPNMLPKTLVLETENSLARNKRGTKSSLCFPPMLYFVVLSHDLANYTSPLSVGFLSDSANEGHERQTRTQ